VAPYSVVGLRRQIPTLLAQKGSSGILVANSGGRSNIERLGFECENQ